VTKLPPIAHAFSHSGFPLELALVSGNNEALQETWHKADWHVPVHVYGFVDNIDDMMRAADLIVCKAGGLIVSEALSVGLPLLIAQAIPGQETGNAELVVQAGAGEMVEDGLDALVTVCHWLEDGGRLLAERSARARELGQPDAAFRVADLAVRAALTGAPPRDHKLTRDVAKLREMISANPLASGFERLLKLLGDV
jgi:1,2-diacylglycerol 3-beta-galactosyltransferase